VLSLILCSDSDSLRQVNSKCLIREVSAMFDMYGLPIIFDVFYKNLCVIGYQVDSVSIVPDSGSFVAWRPARGCAWSL
jgi:hypothetical protein